MSPASQHSYITCITFASLEESNCGVTPRPKTGGEELKNLEIQRFCQFGQIGFRPNFPGTFLGFFVKKINIILFTHTLGIPTFHTVLLSTWKVTSILGT